MTSFIPHRPTSMEWSTSAPMTACCTPSTAETGVEQFAYVPGTWFTTTSAELADPDYMPHLYYVDNTATVARVGSRPASPCLAPLEKGGKGYFGLGRNRSCITWMLPIISCGNSPSAPDDDMGYSFSQANIVNTKAAKGARGGLWKRLRQCQRCLRARHLHLSWMH